MFNKHTTHEVKAVKKGPIEAIAEMFRPYME